MQRENNLNGVILFDGVCNLCNSFVQFVINRDTKNIFKFTSLQSGYSKELLNRFGKDSSKLDSVVLYTDNRIYTESTAALKILKQLGGGLQLLYIFIIVPKFLRDFVYRFIASNRYKWFGKKESCMIPTPELKNKFIE
ncbi:MAG: thiol-disulfide oxidoreductase DCC family protein [Bacteroidota bacterium]|nr:thiol-disulfide oxidoreductase DCC family protein [Bacteroidota bacterium]